MAEVAGGRPADERAGRWVPAEPDEGGNLASRVAREIEAEIIRLGWPIGHNLGSEFALRERYGVSRPVMREAVRLVEHHQAAQMRSGPNGGLLVCAPDAAPATRAIVIYLQYAGTGIEDLQYARLQLEPLAASLAAENITEAGISRLRAILDEEPARRREPGVFSHNVLHTALGELSGNPVLRLFIEVLTRLSARYAHTARSISSEVVTAGKDRAHLRHVDIVGAVVAGDAAAAQNLHAGHLTQVTEWMRDHRADGGRRVVPDLSDLSDLSDGPQIKLAEVVAGRIHDEIVRGGWRVGEVLGSEAELLSRHDVSRAALREAVRLLEYHSVARMRRGPGGGLVISEPRPRASIESMALYLDREGAGAGDLTIVREAVELGILRRVMAEGVTSDALERLGGTLDCATPGAESTKARAERFHTTLAELCGNPVLALFQSILIELWSRHFLDDQPPSGTGRSKAAEAERVHRWIFDAIRDGDEGVALRRMRRHIAALTAWYQ